ncbi:hypothetical protein J5I95_13825 [Candidatus Poribacteria bacterium]|nr:hypothetical protein [Candidatus Poribacteria bacterium]
MVNSILASRKGHRGQVTADDIKRGNTFDKRGTPLELALRRMFPDYCDIYTGYDYLIVDDRHAHKSGYMRLTDRLNQWCKDYDNHLEVQPIDITIRYTDERDKGNRNVFGDTSVLSRDILDYVFTLDIVA